MNSYYLLESSNNEKKYKCPYCEARVPRKKMCFHIQEVHEDLIPQEMTALQVAFNSVNKKNECYGFCTMCHSHTKWNEQKGRYERICDNKKCKDSYIKICAERLQKSRGLTKEKMLSDPEFQNKMLANRSISGTYKFSDGGRVNYVGSYEKNFLEFLDKFMNVHSVDIQAPGPIISYEYNGKEHFWITDAIYTPYNLVFDIKDGGSNPNNRKMDDYRSKQKAKEDAIIKQGKYNYIRLTDNNFSQLISIMLELKELLTDFDSPISQKSVYPIIRINESTTVLESDNDRIKIFNIAIKSLEKENIKCKYSKNSEWGHDNFISGKSDCICLSFNKDTFNQAYSILKNSLKDKNCTVRKDNYFTIFIKCKKYISESSIIPKNINTIIFDFGDVLVHNNSIYTSMENSGIPEKYMNALWNEFCRYANTEFETCSFERAVQLFTNAVDDSLKKYAPVALKAFNENLVQFDYTERLLKHLKNKGYYLYYLSNWNKYGVEFAKNNGVFDFIKYFDGGLFSYEIDIQKPDKRIYNELLTKYNIIPEDSIFFDDKQENIDAAIELGITGVLYTPNIAYMILNEDKIIKSIYNEVSSCCGGPMVDMHNTDSIYIINRIKNNTFAGAIVHGDINSIHTIPKYCRFDDSEIFDNHENISKSILESDISVYKYIGDTNTDVMIRNIAESISNNSFSDSTYKRVFVEVCDTADAIKEVTEETLKFKINKISEDPKTLLSEQFDYSPSFSESYFFETTTLKIKKDENGFYVQNLITGIRCRSRDNINSIPTRVVDIIQTGYIIS